MRKILLPALLIALLLCGCGRIGSVPEPVSTVDPYAGKVQVESGYGTKIWITEYEEIPVNPLRAVNVAEAEQLTGDDGVVYEMQKGIDVSEHQGEIDWAAVAASGEAEFALIRVGYRGYGENGTLCTDAWYRENIRGALDHGLSAGLYFFSQATSEEEAAEEADYLLTLLEGFSPTDFALPVFFDWEEISVEQARTDYVDGETMTRCALAFCERLQAAGYRCGIYAYRSLAYFRYDLPQIADYPLWIAAVGNCPDFYYRFAVWQKSTVGEIPGIEGNVDVDVIFVPADGET